MKSSIAIEGNTRRGGSETAERWKVAKAKARAKCLSQHHTNKFSGEWICIPYNIYKRVYAYTMLYFSRWKMLEFGEFNATFNGLIPMIRGSSVEELTFDPTLFLWSTSVQWREGHHIVWWQQWQQLCWWCSLWQNMVTVRKISSRNLGMFMVMMMMMMTTTMIQLFW